MSDLGVHCSSRAQWLPIGDAMLDSLREHDNGAEEETSDASDDDAQDTGEYEDEEDDEASSVIHDVIEIDD